MPENGWNDEIAGSPPVPAQDDVAWPADTPVAAEIGPVSAPRRRKRVVAALGAAAAVIVAAVAIAIATGSGGAVAQTPAQALDAASRGTTGLRSFSATMTEQFGGAGTARAAFAEQRSPFLMSMNMTEQIAGHTLPISIITTTTTMYIKLGNVPGVPRQLAGKWIKISLSGLGINPLISLTQGSGGYNPVSEVQMLGAGAHVRDAGTQVIGGVQTTRYSGSFAMAAALKHLPASVRSLLSPIETEISGQVHFTVWIDGQHRIRQLAETENAANVPVHMTMTFTGFNQPVTVTIPPASQVYSPPASGLPGLTS
jgi:hypothetical protein